MFVVNPLRQRLSHPLSIGRQRRIECQTVRHHGGRVSGRGRAGVRLQQVAAPIRCSRPSGCRSVYAMDRISVDRCTTSNGAHAGRTQLTGHASESCRAHTLFVLRAGSPALRIFAGEHMLLAARALTGVAAVKVLWMVLAVALGTSVAPADPEGSAFGVYPHRMLAVAFCGLRRLPDWGVAFRHTRMVARRDPPARWRGLWRRCLAAADIDGPRSVRHVRPHRRCVPAVLPLVVPAGLSSTETAASDWLAAWCVRSRRVWASRSWPPTCSFSWAPTPPRRRCRCTSLDATTRPTRCS